MEIKKKVLSFQIIKTRYKIFKKMLSFLCFFPCIYAHFLPFCWPNLNELIKEGKNIAATQNRQLT